MQGVLNPVNYVMSEKISVIQQQPSLSLNRENVLSSLSKQELNVKIK